MNRTDYARQRQLDAIRANPSAALNNPYSMAIARQGGLDVQSLVADQKAKDAGFASAADMAINRTVRNQVESKAAAAGMPLEEAYKLAGPDLTNTAALQEAWNQIPAQWSAPAAKTEEKNAEPEVKRTEKSEEYVSDADKILAGIGDLIGSLPDYSAEINQLREDMATSQRTLAANMSIANRTPNLQIQPASGTPETAGTQSFRRRQRQFGTGSAGTVLAGLNLGKSSMMNV